MPFLLFIRDLLLATLGQMASLFAVIFIFGIVIQFFSQCTFKSLNRSFGSTGTYVVAWLGTPVHELGHALFCIIFLHKIADIKLFKPDPVTGTLGYVFHKWNRRNPWQVLGNFFIGIGPMILGSAVLFALFFLLIPGSRAAWDAVIAGTNHIGDGAAPGYYLEMLRGSSLTLVKTIFTPDNLGGWRFWVFFYLAICVSSNIRLSWSDVKGSFLGIGCFILPFFLINLVAMLTELGSARVFPFTASSLGAVHSVLILALVLAVLGFVLIYIVSAIFYRIRYKGILNPF